MIIKKTILSYLVIFIILPLIYVWAGEVKLTTYYPAPYGEYDTIKTKKNTYLATDANAKVGIGNTNPQRALHVTDTIRLQPRSTAPANPSEGDIYVNSSTHHMYCYLGTSGAEWKQLDEKK